MSPEKFNKGLTGKAVTQYLQRHAEKQATAAANVLLTAVSRQWQYGLLIPVCGESPDTLARVFSRHETATDSLLVICLNQPAGHEKSSLWQRLNRQWLQDQRQQAKRTMELPARALFLEFDDFPDTLVLSRFESAEPAYGALPNKQGVGLARKLAADALLALMHYGAIRSPWIYSTDADAVLPSRYFESTTALPSDCVALSLPFQHKDLDGSQSAAFIAAQKRYDLRLAYYRAGIARINPDYAYVPLGSTLVISALAYAQARGFPRRSAGEDFYLLNKLAKLGRVITAMSDGKRKSDPPLPGIELQVRPSARVPFGTGPAVAAIARLDCPARDYRYYHPGLFLQLARWRQRIRAGLGSESASTAGNDGKKHLVQVFADADKTLKRINAVLAEALPVHDFMRKVYQQNTGSSQRQKQFDEWLDAFRLLKAVHALESEYPRLNLEELAINPFFQRHFLSDPAVSELFHDLWPIA